MRMKMCWSNFCTNPWSMSTHRTTHWTVSPVEITSAIHNHIHNQITWIQVLVPFWFQFFYHRRFASTCIQISIAVQDIIPPALSIQSHAFLRLPKNGKLRNLSTVDNADTLEWMCSWQKLRIKCLALGDKWHFFFAYKIVHNQLLEQQQVSQTEVLFHNIIRCRRSFITKENALLKYHFKSNWIKRFQRQLANYYESIKLTGN